MKDVVIASACRTPIGKFQGGLAGFSAPELGALAAAEAVKRAGIDAADVEEVIFGNVLAAGLGQNPARQVARAAGVPDAVGSLTINKVCGSGLKTVVQGCPSDRAVGEADCDRSPVGWSRMSNAPLPGDRGRVGGVKIGPAHELLDAMVHDGLWDVYNELQHMGS